MSGAGDARRLTNPTLRIRGCIESINTFGDGGGGAGGDSSLSSWLGGVLGLLGCRRRREEWHAKGRATSIQLAAARDIIDRKSARELNFSWLKPTCISDGFKVLLAFPWEDLQSEIIATVARKLGWLVSEARNVEEVAEIFRTGRHDLVIVDRRGPTRSHEADEICRTLLNMCSVRCCNIVALVKKSYFTAPNKDELVILHLLNLGYNRALMECSHEGILMNELIGIYASESQPKNKLAAAQLLYLAVDKSPDIVSVTNDQHVIQFCNKTVEKLLRYKMEEVVGKKLEDFVENDKFPLINQRLQNGEEFEGTIRLKSKEKGLVKFTCRIIPVQIQANKTAYYVYTFDNRSLYSIDPRQSCAVSFQQSNVNSQQSDADLQQRPDSDMTPRSSTLGNRVMTGRRSTMSKIDDLPLEAPITKVISHLHEAMDSTEDPNITNHIQQAIEILNSEKLYEANLKKESEDIFTRDLLGALISVKPKTTTTSMSYGRPSAIMRALNSNQHLINKKMARTSSFSKELEDLLQTSFSWDFDIFKLEVLSDFRPLFFLGTTLMSHYRVAERLGCDERTLYNWLTIIEANYNIQVIYHNSTHASDVLQATARFMQSKRLQMILDPMDEVAVLIAASAHDLDHPGKSSQFLCNASNDLAILYNDLTILESHHAALTFKLTLADEKVNIFKNLTREVYHMMRQNVIDMILATEMSKHFEHLAKFVNVYSDLVDIESTEEMVDMTPFMSPQNVNLIKRMLIKCADVGNPARPFNLCLEWTRRIAEEYFSQTDEEKRKELPLVMPMFDRTTCSIPKSQIGFIDYIIHDMIEAWDAFIDMPELISNIRLNYKKWKILYEQGVKSLEDIQRLQQLPEYQIYRKV